MREKYLVKVYDSEGNLKREAKYKTKIQIKEQYGCDIQTINKIIKINSIENFTPKNQHLQYIELYKRLKIILIKPEINF